MTKTLVERQRKVGRYWFRRVNPVDRFELGREAGRYQLCFDDLMLAYRLEDVATRTTYAARAYDYDGKPTGWKQTTGPGKRGRVCVKGFAPGSKRNGYVIIRLVTRRGGKSMPPTLVHAAKHPKTGVLRLIGLRRY